MFASSVCLVVQYPHSRLPRCTGLVQSKLLLQKQVAIQARSRGYRVMLEIGHPLLAQYRLIDIKLARMPAAVAIEDRIRRIGHDRRLAARAKDRRREIHFDRSSRDRG